MNAQKVNLNRLYLAKIKYNSCNEWITYEYEERTRNLVGMAEMKATSFPFSLILTPTCQCFFQPGAFKALNTHSVRQSSSNVVLYHSRKLGG